MATVLIVDDDSRLAEALAEQVQKAGLGTFICHNARDAIEAIEAMPLQAAIVDLLLPDLPGALVLKACVGRGIPTAAMSGAFIGEGLSQRALEADPRALTLQKPFSGQALVEVARSLVKASAVAAAAVAQAREEEEVDHDMDFEAEAERAADMVRPAAGTFAVPRGSTPVPDARPPTGPLRPPRRLPPSGQLGVGSIQSVPELVAIAHRSRATGELRLKRGAVQKVLWLQQGRLVFAASNLASERFGRFTAQRTAMRKEDLEAVQSLARDMDSKTADAMVRVGLLTEEQRVALLHEQAGQILWSTFGWLDGEVKFTPRPVERQELVLLALPLGKLLWQGYERMPLVELRQGLADGLHLAPVTAPDFERRDLHLSAQQLALLQDADGSKAVSDLLTITDLGEREARALLLALLDARQLEDRPPVTSSRRIMLF